MFTLPPRFSSSSFREALLFAAQLHAKQTRKGTDIPYISHLLAVTSIAIENGANETEAIAALLHDAVEDQGGIDTYRKIRNLFGKQVADIVRGCTDAYTSPKPEWRPRKERYISRLKRANSSVRLVAAADKLHNARTILADYRVMGEAIWERFSGGKQGTLWYYHTLIELFKISGTSPIVEELERVIAELEKHVAQNEVLR